MACSIARESAKYLGISSVRPHLVFSSFSQHWADIMFTLKVSEISHSSYSRKTCLWHYFLLHYCLVRYPWEKIHIYCHNDYQILLQSILKCKLAPEFARDQVWWPSSTSKSTWSVHLVGAKEAQNHWFCCDMDQLAFFSSLTIGHVPKSR